MAEPFFRETRAVQLRTVFGDAPCLKLSVDGYNFSHLSNLSLELGLKKFLMKLSRLLISIFYPIVLLFVIWNNYPKTNKLCF